MMRTKTRVSADLYREMCSECKEQPEALQAGDKHATHESKQTFSQVEEKTERRENAIT